ncbi:DEAD/DEAH box helicase [Streptomyces sp. CA-111067]|uniref:DEAD/DEAH box helicase n=1 Tax=Streptomyces sp. CA-111067 TaxID=3240046 RepID=UPI003D96F4C6
MGRPADVLARADRLRGAAATLIADHDLAKAAVAAAVEPLLDERVARELDGMPVARLRDATRGTLAVTALEQAGIGSVGQVAAATAYQLRALPGIGAATAAQLLTAAEQIARAARDGVTVRIDVERQDPRDDALIAALGRLLTAGPELSRHRRAAEQTVGDLDALLPGARPARSRMRMLAMGGRRREQVMAAVAGLDALLTAADRADVLEQLTQSIVDLLRSPPPAAEARIDFELRAADYYSVLDTLAGPAPAAAEGHLPSDLVQRVRAQPLDDAYLRVSLRGYQEFGARFALVQERVVLGDEMGLGKTVEAIAVLAHLAAGGERRFLVVCPPGLLVNWTREITARSTLTPVRVHGPGRQRAYRDWLRDGGVAVTTFDTLHTLEPPVAEPPPAPPGGSGGSRRRAERAERAARAARIASAGRVRPGTLDLLVVDEAHFAKNPATRRSRSVANWTGGARRALYLTGTPMENRLEEFRTLVEYLRPRLTDMVSKADAAADPAAFRAAIAPAYLRRNRQDVLTELPELVHTDEWAEFSTADLAAYRAAVEAGNFAAMRRAAYADPAHSAKLRRLRDLVAEAATNGLKVVVFSCYREVLAAVHGALGGSREGAALHGPLTGAVPADGRQQLVDEFSAAPGHAVLVAQIQAGGIGLNLQAASVVVLCEPQLTPATESQAVSRAHRMGQIRGVRVHRLLAADSVDQRLVDLLGAKSRLFDEYARRSDVAEAAPEALDISEQSLARQVVAHEQLRLALPASR